MRESIDGQRKNTPGGEKLFGKRSIRRLAYTLPARAFTNSI